MADLNGYEDDAASELTHNANVIAHMLSGAEITSEARAQADRLLEGV